MGIESLDPFTGTSPFNRTELLNELASIAQRVIKMTNGPGILLQNSDAGITIATIDEAGDGDVEGSGGLFPVTVEKVSGIAGSKTLQCTFGYRVTSLSGDTVYGEDLTPQKNRMSIGLYVEGGGENESGDTNSNVGLAYFNGGEFVLYDANEVPGAAACS